MTRITGRIVAAAAILFSALIAATEVSAVAVANPHATSAIAPSYAYISASRQGSAVYVNALIKQGSPAGIVRSGGRTVYLQRNLTAGWQTMLKRVTNAQGQFTVGFISVPNYQYRFIVVARAGTAAATSGIAQTVSPPAKYTNCASLNAVYPHGVGKPGAHDHVATGGTPVTSFTVSLAVYNLNPARDADHDGIACERK